MFFFASQIINFTDHVVYDVTTVSAVFSLAYKLQPAIIFIDEVDSFLGQRRSTDNEVLTNMKTEFMALWDGFTTDRKYSTGILISIYAAKEYMFNHILSELS